MPSALSVPSDPAATATESSTTARSASQCVHVLVYHDTIRLDRVPPEDSDLRSTLLFYRVLSRFLWPRVVAEQVGTRPFNCLVHILDDLLGLEGPLKA